MSAWQLAAPGSRGHAEPVYRVHTISDQSAMMAGWHVILQARVGTILRFPPDQRGLAGEVCTALNDAYKAGTEAQRPSAGQADYLTARYAEASERNLAANRAKRQS